jgi:ribonuclease HI
VNTAEWTGLCSGLEGVLDLLENDSELGCLQDLRVLTVIGDSRLVIDQCTGSFACRSHLLKPYFRRAAKVVSALSRKGITVGFKWVSRYHNVEADRMSKYGHAEENKALTQRVAEQNSFRLVV